MQALRDGILYCGGGKERIYRSERLGFERDSALGDSGQHVASKENRRSGRTGSRCAPGRTLPCAANWCRGIPPRAAECGGRVATESWGSGPGHRICLNDENIHSTISGNPGNRSGRLRAWLLSYTGRGLGREDDFCCKALLRLTGGGPKSSGPSPGRNRGQVPLGGGRRPG